MEKMVFAGIELWVTIELRFHIVCPRLSPLAPATRRSRSVGRQIAVSPINSERDHCLGDGTTKGNEIPKKTCWSYCRASTRLRPFVAPRPRSDAMSLVPAAAVKNSRNAVHPIDRHSTSFLPRWAFSPTRSTASPKVSTSRSCGHLQPTTCQPGPLRTLTLELRLLRRFHP
jgi:hypothetical protein